MIDKIPYGHELYCYRDRLMEEIPDNEELRDTSGSSRDSSSKKEDKKKKNHDGAEYSLRELNEITESALASGRYQVNRRKLEYFKYLNKWKNVII